MRNTIGDMWRNATRWVSRTNESYEDFLVELEEWGDADPELWILEDFVVRDRRQEVRTKKLKRGRPHGYRSWDEITGVTNHQTACLLPAGHPKLLAVPAHAHVSQRAIITLLQPATAYMHQAHHLNGETIGVECEARAGYIEGQARGFWRRKSEKKAGKTYADLAHEATDGQLEALAALHRYYAAKKARMCPDAELLGLYTHRQGHRSRTSDPGSRIAQFLHRNLVLSGEYRDVSHETRGAGNPWPEEWKQ